MTIKTITVSGVTEVDFDPLGNNPLFYASERFAWVKNFSDGDMYISSNSSCTANADGTAYIPKGEAAMYNIPASNKLYISGTGKAEIRTSDIPDCPFKKDAKGGDEELFSYADGNSGMIFIMNSYVPEIENGFVFEDTAISLEKDHSITVEICMKLSSDRQRTGRYVEFNSMDLIISDEYYDSKYWIEIALGGDHWYLSRNVEQLMDENITLSIVIGANGTLLYRNGVLLFTDSTATDALLPTADVDTLYLMRGTNSNRSCPGNLYAFRFYSRALSAGEIAANYAEDRKLIALADPAQQ